jgi:hypothetical protein
MTSASDGPSIAQAQGLLSLLAREHDILASQGTAQDQVWNVRRWMVDLESAISESLINTKIRDGWWTEWAKPPAPK